MDIYECGHYRRSWTAKQDSAFQVAKKALQADSLLVHFDDTRPLVLTCDASPYGIGAVLSHTMEDGNNRPIAFASRTFMKGNGIKHVTTAPYHPSSNGQAERAVQIVKQALKSGEGDNVQEKLSKYLFRYQILPPAELLMEHCP